MAQDGGETQLNYTGKKGMRHKCTQELETLDRNSGNQPKTIRIKLEVKSQNTNQTEEN